MILINPEISWESTELSEWEESCLSFHKTERPIATSSYIQVRRPMYRDSINLLMILEKQLESSKKVFNQ